MVLITRLTENSKMHDNFQKTILTNCNQYSESNENVHFWGYSPKFVKYFDQNKKVLFFDEKNNYIYITSFNIVNKYLETDLGTHLYTASTYKIIVGFTTILKIGIESVKKLRDNFKCLMGNQATAEIDDIEFEKILGTDDEYASLKELFNEELKQENIIIKEKYLKSPKDKTHGTIYLARLYPKNLTKIGKSKQNDPFGRLKDYINNDGQDIVKLYTIPVPMNMVDQVETEIKKLYRTIKDPSEGEEFFDIEFDMMEDMLNEYYEQNNKFRSKPIKKKITPIKKINPIKNL